MGIQISDIENNKKQYCPVCKKVQDTFVPSSTKIRTCSVCYSPVNFYKKI